LEGNIINMIQK